MGHMVLPLIDFNCQNLHKFIYKLSEHATMDMDGGTAPAELVLSSGDGAC